MKKGRYKFIIFLMLYLGCINEDKRSLVNHISKEKENYIFPGKEFCDVRVQKRPNDYYIVTYVSDIINPNSKQYNYITHNDSVRIDTAASISSRVDESSLKYQTHIAAISLIENPYLSSISFRCDEIDTLTVFRFIPDYVLYVFASDTNKMSSKYNWLLKNSDLKIENWFGVDDQSASKTKESVWDF